jgi:sucrose phosphorylase
VDTVRGRALVWTTFSDDQIDLNYACPELMLRVLDLLLFYVSEGAEIIRLDAIAYLWKEIGSSCIHLPQTYEVVRLMRAVLDAVAPGVLLITETNVPHEENVSYFGRPLASGGTDAAQLVYQFSLAPLTMHSILTGDATVLTGWAEGLAPPPQATFFNFTASHDGIGVRPAEGLLAPEQVQGLVDATIAHGGRVSYKSNPDGSRSAYELNISYFDALSDPAADESVDRQVARFIVSQAIMLAMAGVPGIYVHSLLGSRSWHAGVAETGRNRTINREKLPRGELERALADPQSVRHKVYHAYAALLRARAAEAAFHPFGEQVVLSLDARIFVLLRRDPRAASRALCLHNVSDQAFSASIPLALLGDHGERWRDMLTGEVGRVGGSQLRVDLGPYAVRWLAL